MNDQTFYSKKHKCFVKIKDGIIYMDGKQVDLLPEDTVKRVEKQKELLDDLLHESKTKCKLQKRKSHAFGKDIFLLGKRKDNKFMWLEEPKWDCEWYWGFGYIKTYTNNNNPGISRDIDSHSHFSGLVGKQEYYDHDKQCFRLGKYIHNVYDSPKLIETAFTEKEGWQLSELFKEFYLLQEMAEFCHKERPGCHVATSPVDHGNMKNWYEKINKEMIPRITTEILRMLTPMEENKDEKDN